MIVVDTPMNVDIAHIDPGITLHNEAPTAGIVCAAGI